MSPKVARIMPGSCARAMALSMSALVGDADRAARAGEQAHRRRQQAADAVAEDGDGVGAAHLHQVHRPPGGALDGQGQALGRRAVAELLDVAQARPPAWTTLRVPAERPDPAWRRNHCFAGLHPAEPNSLQFDHRHHEPRLRLGRFDHLRQQAQGLLGVDGVHLLEGVAGVEEDVVAHGHVGQEREARLAHDSSQLHQAQEAVPDLR